MDLTQTTAVPVTTVPNAAAVDNEPVQIFANTPVLLTDFATNFRMLASYDDEYPRLIHSSVKLSGREIFLLRKVDSMVRTGDSRLFDGDRVMLNHSHLYVRGQTMSRFTDMTYENDKKAIFVVKIVGGRSGEEGSLSSGSEFALYSEAWPDCQLGWTMEEPFFIGSTYRMHNSVFMGYLALSRRGKASFEPMTFRATPTALENRMPPLTIPQTVGAGAICVTCARCGNVMNLGGAAFGYNMRVQCSNCLSYNRIPQIAYVSAPVAVMRGPPVQYIQHPSNYIPMTTQYAAPSVVQRQGYAQNFGERFQCPHCYLFFTAAEDVFNHVSSAHSGAVARQTAIPVERCPTCGYVAPDAPALVDHVVSQHEKAVLLPPPPSEHSTTPFSSAASSTGGVVQAKMPSVTLELTDSERKIQSQSSPKKNFCTNCGSSLAGLDKCPSCQK